MLLSVGFIGDGMRGAVHPNPLCLTSRMLIGLLQERRALLTNKRPSSVVVYSTVIAQMRQPKVAEVAFDERI